MNKAVDKIEKVRNRIQAWAEREFEICRSVRFEETPEYKQHWNAYENYKALSTELTEAIERIKFIWGA